MTDVIGGSKRGDAPGLLDIRSTGSNGGRRLVMDAPDASYHGGFREILIAEVFGGLPRDEMWRQSHEPADQVRMQANAERLRDCWNACEGIEDPTDLRRQRDELLAACEFALSEGRAYVGEEEHDDSPNGEILRRLAAAIAFARGVASETPPLSGAELDAARLSLIAELVGDEDGEPRSSYHSPVVMFWDPDEPTHFRIQPGLGAGDGTGSDIRDACDAAMRDSLKAGVRYTDPPLARYAATVTNPEGAS